MKGRQFIICLVNLLVNCDYNILRTEYAQIINCTFDFRNENIFSIVIENMSRFENGTQSNVIIGKLLTQLFIS